MLPHLELGPVRLPTYAVVLTCAIAVGLWVTVARGRRENLSRSDVLVPAVLAIGFAFAGAKLWSVAFELAPQLHAARRSLELRHLTEGGLSIVGGLVGGVLGAFVGTRQQGLALLRFSDTAAVGVALAIGIARLGCLAAGCCHGAPTLFPIAVVYDDWDAAARPIGVPLHATQLYESLLCGALALLLARAPPKLGLRTGALFLGYGVARFAVEQLRADYRGLTLGWPTTMVAAVGLALAGGALVWRSRQRATP